MLPDVTPGWRQPASCKAQGGVGLRSVIDLSTMHSLDAGFDKQCLGVYLLSDRVESSKGLTRDGRKFIFR